MFSRRMRQSVNQWRTTAFQGVDIDGFIVGRAILPTPIEDADPFAYQSPYGGLMGFALVALLLLVDLGPEGMPDRFCRPRHACVAEELRTLEAPMHPGLLAATFGHRRDSHVSLQFSGGGIALPLCAEGDEEPWVKAEPAPGGAWLPKEQGGPG